jgi:pseudouridine kinase
MPDATNAARIVIVGGTNLDIQGKSFAPFSPEDSNPGSCSRSAGGVGRNIAENCVRLGIDTRIVTVFGSDEDSAFLEADCISKGIDTSGSHHIVGNCARYLCLLDERGNLVGAVADMAAMDALTPEVLDSRRTLLDAARIIIADTNIPAESLAWLASRYGRSSRILPDGEAAAPALQRPLLFLDPVSAAKAAKAVGISGEFDAMKPNLGEASVLAGVGRRPVLSLSGELPLLEEKRAEARRCSQILASLHRAPAELYLSLGEFGILYHSESGEEGHIPLPPADVRPEVVNRSGAGDAACAALAWATLQGFSPQQKACCAITAALITSSSLDPVSPELDPGHLKALMNTLFPHVSTTDLSTMPGSDPDADGAASHARRMP